MNIQEIEKFDTVIDQISDELEKTIDWKAILEASKEIKPVSISSEKIIKSKKIKFAIAKDEAFNFIYPQNIAAMKTLGTVDFFSPIHDAKIPRIKDGEISQYVYNLCVKFLISGQIIMLFTSYISIYSTIFFLSGNSSNKSSHFKFFSNKFF